MNIEGVTGNKEEGSEKIITFGLKNEGRCWTEFYKYVTRRKGNRENNPAIKENIGKLITDPIERANSLNCHYASLFSCERNTRNPQIQSTESGKPFNIRINIIKKRLSTIGRKKSVRPDGIPGEIF
jgi:hypothetical protein